MRTDGHGPSRWVESRHHVIAAALTARLELHGQPLDHPSLPAWPEGRYLKFAVLRGTREKKS